MGWKAEVAEGPVLGLSRDLREVGLRSGPRDWTKGQGSNTHEFLDPRSSGEGPVAAKMEWGKELAASDQLPYCLWSGLLRQAGLELPESRKSPMCPKPSWFPQSQALLCPELAPLGEDRANLAARQAGVRGARKPQG